MVSYKALNTPMEAIKCVKLRSIWKRYCSHYSEAKIQEVDGSERMISLFLIRDFPKTIVVQDRVLTGFPLSPARHSGAIQCPCYEATKTKRAHLKREWNDSQNYARSDSSTKLQ